MKERNAKKSAVRNQPAGSVIVVYENPAVRELAVGFCNKFACESCADVGLGGSWYSFEELTVPARMEAAAEVAVGADLLAFSVTASGDLPAAIKLWTEIWLRRRGEREGWLVGLVLEDGAELRRVACLKEIYLRHLAHRAGMDYLSHFPAKIPRAIPDSLDSFNRRAEQVTPVLDEILHTRFVSIPPLK